MPLVCQCPVITAFSSPTYIHFLEELGFLAHQELPFAFKISPFMSNRISRPYQLDESIEMGCWVLIYNHIQISKV